VKLKKTESGEFKRVGENMSDRGYAEYLESKGSTAWPCMTAPLYFKGKEYPQDYKKSAEVFLGNDIRFCTPGFVYLGAMFKHGLGVAKDPARAKYWFRAHFAATPKPAENLEGMAKIIENIQSAAGVRIKTDFEAALAWLEKTLEEPPVRLYERGLAYLKTGEAVAGFPIADAMLVRAARSGHERAALTHARLYLDCKIGAYGRSPWFYLPRFAEAGHAEAAALLGLYYAENSEKRFSNYLDARDWLDKALAGDLPIGLWGKAEAALAWVSALLEEKDRRRSQ